MVTCGVMAGLVHFSMMSSICWMGVEGFNMFKIIVKTNNPDTLEYFMLKAYVFAIGKRFLGHVGHVGSI